MPIMGVLFAGVAKADEKERGHKKYKNQNGGNACAIACTPAALNL
jgi:hypothetical protein